MISVESFLNEHRFIFGATLSILLFALDFFLNRRVAQFSNPRYAIQNICIYLFLVALFFAATAFLSGIKQATVFLATYGIELSLSLDNLIIFTMIAKSLKINRIYLIKMLPFTVLITMIARLLFIIAGVEFIKRFQFGMLVFAVFLLYIGVKMVKKYLSTLINHEAEAPNDHIRMIKFLSKFIPISKQSSSNSLFVKEGRFIKVTNNFLALIGMIVADIMCSLDSIPSAIAFTTDVYTIYMANLFSILGLRSAYVVVDHWISKLSIVDLVIGFLLIVVAIKTGLPFVLHLFGL